MTDLTHRDELAFLGNVESDAEASLLHELSTVEMAPFRLQLTTPGHFVRADITFVAPKPNDALVVLHRHVADVVAKCGLAEEGDWHPHVTLARKAAAANPPLAKPALEWFVTSFSLVLSAAGQYETIKTWGSTTVR